MDLIYHSDSLYSAVSAAMARLGLAGRMAGGHGASADAPAVRFSSCFPFAGDTLLVVPPRSLWPPPASTKIRWKGARFVPLVGGRIAAGRQGDRRRPLGRGRRERMPGAVQSGRADRSASRCDRAPAWIACTTRRVEFTPPRASNSRAGAGLWTLVQFADDDAAARLGSAGSKRAAAAGRFRLRRRTLARLGTIGSAGVAALDSAGAELTEQAGRARVLAVVALHPGAAIPSTGSAATMPRVSRSGRVESSARWGEPKKPTRMVAEGSVLLAGSANCAALPRDVAPEGFPHPVYRAGFAVDRSDSLAGGRMNIPRHLPDSDAGRRRPKAFAHRLHGVEGPRQRSRSAAHLPPAGQGSAPRRLSERS